MAQETKRSRHTGAKVTVTAAAILALLAGGHFGLGIGRGGEGAGLLPGQQAPAQNTVETAAEPAEEAETGKDDGVLAVTVQEDGILYEGKAVSLSELEAALLSDYTGEKTVTLTDDHAIKSAYDEVTALLDKLSIPYTAAE